ncbi:MAG: RidA family protein [Bacteroidota bacterium]|nr:RidA family protein [Bacteroidota bacterium]
MKEAKVIKTPNAPAAIGPYHQAIKVNGFLFCSGQIAIDPKSGKLVTENISQETKQVMENISALLKAESLGTSDIVKTTIFLKNMDNYAAVNEVYASYFQDENFPAREAVEVSRLPKNVNIEISIIASI